MFLKPTVLNGRDTTIRCVEIAGQHYEVTRGPLRVARLEDEWHEDIADPAAAIDGCRKRADLFTFWQRPPDTEIRHPYHYEFEHVAALPLTTYDRWWTTQQSAKARNKVRRAEKTGVTVRVCDFDDDFVCGMTAIFNESPVRQGRRFWHYGKDVETVRRQFSRFLHRETLIRADLHGEMVGLVMLSDAGRFALIGQIISSLRHRDKGVNNALMAKTVEVCCSRNVPLLCYYFWDDGTSLTHFKRSNGFEKMSLPRYYVPLSWRGQLAMTIGAHRGLRRLLPARIKAPLKRARAALLSA